ncbi:hypothetical protein ACI2OX_05395 [Bacillus sp. N9]
MSPSSRENMIRDVQENIECLQKKLTQLEETMKNASREERKIVSQQVGNQLAILLQFATLI